MERLWKHLMHLDARALFIGALALFLVVAGIVTWLYLHRVPETKAPVEAPPAAAPIAGAADVGLLGMISNQMSADALVVPVNPFRPSLENMAALYAPTPSTAGVVRVRTFTNHFGRFRPPKAAQPVIPTLTFRGYFQRPDGTPAALFHDSVDDASRFVTPGGEIRGVTLVAADMRSAKVKKPDGQVATMAIGDSFTLPAIKP
jgi:hypothetical protein